MLSHLRGMFSFALYDKKEKELFCARDHFGIKPFYYYNDNNCFIFASEIKAFLDHPDFIKEFNEDSKELSQCIKAIQFLDREQIKQHEAYNKEKLLLFYVKCVIL